MSVTSFPICAATASARTHQEASSVLVLRATCSAVMVLSVLVCSWHKYTERQKKHNFLEWCPLKSTASKWMIFGLMLATVLLITHIKKQRNRKSQKWDKCLQITTSPVSKITETAPFPPRRLSNSYSFKYNSRVRNHVHNRFALQQNYCEHDYGSRYWMWMNSYWNVWKSVWWKGSSFCDFEIGLVIWRHLSNFWHIRFLCFLTWVMMRTVANINPKIINFDAVDFSGHHSKKL